MTLAEFILDHRMQKKLSARKLGELSGISHTEIHRIENGERTHPSPGTLRALAAALDIPMEVLMMKAGYMDEKPEGPALDTSGLDERELAEVQDFIDFLRSRH